MVRREGDGIRRYVHLGTGNYNPVDRALYTDLGFFTCDPSIGADVTDLFNCLTGYSRKDATTASCWSRPIDLRERAASSCIEREIERHAASTATATSSSR